VFVFIRNSRRYVFVLKRSLRDPYLKRIAYAMNQEYKALIHAYVFLWARILVLGILNPELCIKSLRCIRENKMKYKGRDSTGKFLVYGLYLLQFVLAPGLYLLQFVLAPGLYVLPFLLIVSFSLFFIFLGLFSGPAHILCLIVASGWNKEQCMPEIFSLLLTKLFCHVTHCVTFTLLLLQGDVFDVPCLQH
jgi:hypothetical protein